MVEKEKLHERLQVVTRNGDTRSGDPQLLTSAGTRQVAGTSPASDISRLVRFSVLLHAAEYLDPNVNKRASPCLRADGRGEIVPKAIEKNELKKKTCKSFS